jgi:hypothetical protein
MMLRAKALTIGQGEREMDLFEFDDFRSQRADQWSGL